MQLYKILFISEDNTFVKSVKFLVSGIFEIIVILLFSYETQNDNLSKHYVTF